MNKFEDAVPIKKNIGKMDNKITAIKWLISDEK